MTRETLLEQHLLAAVRPALGRRLISVEYLSWPGYFEPEAVNTADFWFGGEVRLTFAGDVLVFVSWGRKLSSLSESAFALIARDESTFTKDAEMLPFDASRAPQWSGLFGETLDRAQVYGVGVEPHILELGFGTRSVLLAVGNEESGGQVGDCEDILIRSEGLPRMLEQLGGLCLSNGLAPGLLASLERAD